MNSLTDSEVSELYYLANRQYMYYLRKFQQYSKKNIADEKLQYFYERCKMFDCICGKLLKMNPNTLVKIDDLERS